MKTAHSQFQSVGMESEARGDQRDCESGCEKAVTGVCLWEGYFRRLVRLARGKPFSSQCPLSLPRP